MKFSNLSSEEIERRRQVSVEAYEHIKREEFAAWYRERCDSRYWKFGQRCSGCDFWESDQGNWGECHYAGILSAQDVMSSIGVTWCSMPMSPGFPFRHEAHWCANFKDDFDWSTLPPEYLERIGAMRGGLLRDKPSHKAPE